jgi:hypothetical protein
MPFTLSDHRRGELKEFIKMSFPGFANGYAGQAVEANKNE